MSIPQEPTPARLFVSILFAREPACDKADFVEKVIRVLSDELGPVDFTSEITPFRQTNYYDQEMGPGLLRMFVSFQDLQPRGRLADVKLFSNRVETLFCRPDGSRRCNIDPGLLSVENFILATGKNFTHRIYLRDGIFSEVTLLFQNGKLQVLPWTYWDYAAEEVLAMLTQLRKRLIADLKAQKLL